MCLSSLLTCYSNLVLRSSLLFEVTVLDSFSLSHNFFVYYYVLLQTLTSAQISKTPMHVTCVNHSQFFFHLRWKFVFSTLVGDPRPGRRDDPAQQLPGDDGAEPGPVWRRRLRRDHLRGSGGDDSRTAEGLRQCRVCVRLSGAVPKTTTPTTPSGTMFDTAIPSFQEVPGLKLNKTQLNSSTHPLSADQLLL